MNHGIDAWDITLAQKKGHCEETDGFSVSYSMGQWAWLTPQWPVDWPDAIIFFLQHISPKIPTERKHSNYTASKQGVTARIRGLRHRRLIGLQKIALTIRWVFCYFVINGMFLVWPITLLYNTPRALVGFLQLPMCHALTLLKMSKPHGCCLNAPKQQQI